MARVPVGERCDCAERLDTLGGCGGKGDGGDELAELVAVDVRFVEGGDVVGESPKRAGRGPVEKRLKVWRRVAAGPVTAGGRRVCDG